MTVMLIPNLKSKNKKINEKKINEKKIEMRKEMKINRVYCDVGAWIVCR